MIVAAVLAAGLVASCGSSKNTTSASTSAPTTSPGVDAAFIGRVNAICARATKGITPFPYRSFDPTHPDPKLLPKVGAYLAEHQAAADAVPAQLRELGAPATGQAIWSQMLALATSSRAIADRQIKAAKASDVPAFVATLGPVRQTSTQLAQLGKQAGFGSNSPCGTVF